MTNRIYQPRAFDLVGDPVQVAGVGRGFETVLHYRIGDGHDEVSGTFHVGGGTGEHAQFQLQVDLGDAELRQDRIFVQVFERSARDGSEVNKVTVPAIYGPRIVPGYIGYREHEVEEGDTLSGLAKTHYGDADRYQRIVRANPQVEDPDRIFPGQILQIPIGSP
ncbi:Gmad2 immunoglobulin-like domain-containing protein [Streptomyces sp. TRM70308]|uniref:Gmad2 immunoglobulin-like domain-containing protein n=1 Tax=Streptomyces sp. TRM70308 TaxID=3131932 RepID=UPI003D083F78